MTAHSAHSHVRTYLVIYVMLMVLLALTVIIAHVHLGILAVPLALGIAVTKAVLIILYFMHVKDEVPLVRLFAAAGGFWVLLLFAFMFSDYLTRPEMHQLEILPAATSQQHESSASAE